MVQYVIPFVEQHLTSQDWRRREAATLAFGSILEGPSANVLMPYLPQAATPMRRPCARVMLSHVL